ncbi:HD domain-containing protein [Dyella sp. Tek66A03]|uniref:HD domain-containing protein n=1 Tax=Dyella sp. Tek66A03 TaxID=3458298 RepID=UPI00403ED915
MADILIRHLNKKSDEHAALKTLTSQWDFDSKIIPKALQTVGHLFPHYSRHDESHSRQILINIERLLGDAVSSLTATDTWLLLEAAYWHDMGMIVPQQDIVDELQSGDFLDYLADLKRQPQHELFRFASSFDPSDLSKCFVGADTPTDALTRFTELMAEWFRRKHPSRAEAMVRSPWASAGISSPRTELMPARLFRVLGRICQMHGASFDAVLSPEGLPFKEAGMANEDCHPRFVACLLRLGDLLDLDDNRFCPVLQRIAGEGRPAISRAHEDKHQAIRHLRIDRNRIEVSAECQTIPGYLEAFKWFDWLKQEMHSQMAHWQEIAPSRELGLLPTLGDLTVTLSGELQILQEGRRPQFGVDEKSVMGLLQGSNLYNSAFPCIRELLQNAVDATLLSIWAKESPKVTDGQWVSPSQCKLLQEAPLVRVELIETNESASEDDKAVWLLRISDGGTGISSADLLHMLRVGGSQTNRARQRLIRKMPEWMKPSGAFGIGLQSAFMLSESIVIETKSIFSNETLKLEMHSPVGPNEGLVLVRRLANDVAREYGTTVEIKLRLDRFARRWQIPAYRRDTLAASLVTSMDPLLDDTFPYDAGRMADEVMAFGEKSPIRVSCRFVPLAKEAVALSSDLANLSDGPSDWHFVADAHGHCVELRYRPTRDINVSHQSRFLYRGQPFECKSVYFPNVRFDINLLSGSAGTWLSANRDELAPKAAEAIEAVVLSALTQVVNANMEQYRASPSERPGYWPELSLFLNTMALDEGEPWARFAAETGDAWKDVSVMGASIRECFKRDVWHLGTGADHTSGPIEACDVSTGDPGTDVLPTLALVKWKEETNGSVKILAVDELASPVLDEVGPASDANEQFQRTVREQRRMSPVLRFSREAQNLYSDTALAQHLINATRATGNRRYLLAFDEPRWKGLVLKKDVKLHASWLFRPSDRSASVILLPYLFASWGIQSAARVQASPSQLTQLCLRIQPLLAAELAVDEVRRLYETLIAYIDTDFMQKSPYAALWYAAREGASAS